MTTIYQAHCSEIGRTVTAREAQAAYLDKKAKGRWEFFCEHAECRAAEVRVTCANYWRSASKEATYVAPHYRHLDKHLPGCVYELGPPERPSAPTVETDPRPGRGSKADDLIDLFDPGDDGDSARGGSATRPPADGAPGQVGPAAAVRGMTTGQVRPRLAL